MKHKKGLVMTGGVWAYPDILKRNRGGVAVYEDAFRIVTGRPRRRTSLFVPVSLGVTAIELLAIVFLLATR